MATKIKIGHASISENNSINGSAGDSTGREVYINEDFSITGLSPDLVLRPKTQKLAENSAKACEAGCANDHIGYSQNGRNTLYSLAKDVEYDLSKVNKDCNTDCSAFMTVCAIAGGSKISYGSNAPTTTNMRARFKQSGDYTIITGSKYLTSTDYLKRGDILVCEGSHTVMVLENGISVSDEEITDGVDTGITPITDIRIRCIDMMVDTTEETKAIASFNIIERKAGAPDKALSVSTIKNYTWSYKLEKLEDSTTKTGKFTLESSKHKLSFTDLKPGTTYSIQIVATNKKSESKEFCSSRVLFTTLPTKTSSSIAKQEFTGKALNIINRIYVKVADVFKQAVIYKNEV